MLLSRASTWASGYALRRVCFALRQREQQAEAHPSTDKDSTVILATSYPFLEVVWTMLVFFAFVVWIWILFTVLADIFRRHDTSGFAKVMWIVFVIILPYLGVFVYLIAEHEGMTERAITQQKAAQSQFDQYVQSVAAQGDPTEQIAKAKQLLDAGTITQTEFDQIKTKALAAA
jgi:Phospholipase_D-nuclease N-terminal